MIIVSITGPDMSDALAQIHSSRAYANLFEIRLDLIRRPDVDLLFTATGKPTIATCRPEWEAGGFRGSEHERLDMLRRAVVAGAEYVDVELQCGREIVQEFTCKVIVSIHVFGERPRDITRAYRALRRSGGDVLKLAFSAYDVSDNELAFSFFAMAKQDRQKAIAIAMGEHGEPSRILYRKFGGWATYAAPESGAGSAPGQIAGSVLKKLYRADKITSRTKVYGVIGNPVSQSKGVLLHNPLFHMAKRNAVYCRFPVIDLGKFMRTIARHLDGFSVTIPHKQSVIRYLGRVDETTQAIGAVNTVVRRGKELVGSNTDAAGALDAIEEVIRVKGRRLLIVGAGGAARAIAYEAKHRGAEVYVANRTPHKASRLAKEFGIYHVRMSVLSSLRFDVLVNATSVGMFPEAEISPVPGALLMNKVVFDAVYNPPMTKLLRDAEAVGATVIKGTEMYVNQAARQFTLYTGVTPASGVMKRLLKHTSAPFQ